MREKKWEKNERKKETKQKKKENWETQEKNRPTQTDKDTDTDTLRQHWDSKKSKKKMSKKGEKISLNSTMRK